MSPDIKDRIIEQLPSLPDSILMEIKKLIDKFKNGSNQAAPADRFDDLFNTITEKDAREMLDAVEDCERIDSNGW